VFNFDFPTVDVGDSLGNVTGVVSYSFGNFEIIPTEDFTDNITPANLQPEVSSIVRTSDQLTVASYNVLNLDPNDSDGDTDIADGRFDTIASQIINNLNSPDIIGLQEVQDNSGSVDDGTVAADQNSPDLN
jgi:predicted extracellular nuclease